MAAYGAEPHQGRIKTQTNLSSTWHNGVHLDEFSVAPGDQIRRLIHETHLDQDTTRGGPAALDWMTEHD